MSYLMHRSLASVALAVAVLIGAGAGSSPALASPLQEPPPRACTMIGCTSGVSIETTRVRDAFPKAATVTVCMDGRCRRSSATSAQAEVTRPSQSSAGPVRVRVVIRDRRGAVLERFARRVSLTRMQPNGPSCDPVCWRASFRITSSRRLTRIV